jgi:hypothetical protein
MRPRIEQELVLLHQFLPEVEHLELPNEDWFLLPQYKVPVGWRIGDAAIAESRICFPIGSGYPSAHPYGFLMPLGINFQGTSPGNSGSSSTPPFEGGWHHFSWSPDGWFPHSDVSKGSNLMMWIRSFTNRLKEGV